jgi:hypothetical protein
MKTLFVQAVRFCHIRASLHIKASELANLSQPYYDEGERTVIRRARC